jgi:polyhydroxybutyrate depolymerase
MKNKYIFTVIIALVVIISSCGKDDELDSKFNCSAGTNAITFNHNGQIREYLLYKPENLPANAPLVFVLHGSTQNAEYFYNNIGFNQVADTAKFAVCYPQGIDCFWLKDELNTTDVSFLKDLAQFLQTEHNLSVEKTFSTGFSAGGAMSYLLALEANDIFKAVAPVAGGINDVVWDSKNPQTAIPVFTIHGTDDQIVPINGINGGGKGGVQPAQTVVDYFKTLNNCTETNTIQFTTKTTATYYVNGTNNNEVWYYKISGQDHIFPGDTDPIAMPYDKSGFNGAKEIWRFFSKW